MDRDRIEFGVPSVCEWSVQWYMGVIHFVFLKKLIEAHTTKTVDFCKTCAISRAMWWFSSAGKCLEPGIRSTINIVWNYIKLWDLDTRNQRDQCESILLIQGISPIDYSHSIKLQRTYITLITKMFNFSFRTLSLSVYHSLARTYTHTHIPSCAHFRVYIKIALCCSQ